MVLVERIDHDLKEAMKAKEEQRLSTLRLIRSALKNKQIDLRRELLDEDIEAVLRTTVKQYREALADFVAAGRQDLVERQQAEIATVETYLPAAMSDEEIEVLCRQVILDMQATSKDLGKVIGAVVKASQTRADGNKVREILQKLFTSSTN